MNISSGSEDGDPLREARAYNQSIYLMVATPYVLLGTLGFMIYRGIKAAEKRTKARFLNTAGQEHDQLLNDRDRPKE